MAYNLVIDRGGAFIIKSLSCDKNTINLTDDAIEKRNESDIRRLSAARPLSALLASKEACSLEKRGDQATTADAEESLRGFERFVAELDEVSSEGAVKTDSVAVLLPQEKTSEGILVKSLALAWTEVVQALLSNWSIAYELSAEKWEEIVAGAFDKAGFDSVTLTPRSGDHGRDIIAIKKGTGCVKIIDSVKAYGPDRLVKYDDVRALLGVMTGERDTSKGIITTTSDFPPRIMDDPFIAPFVPYRLELMNCDRLKGWLGELIEERPTAS